MRVAKRKNPPPPRMSAELKAALYKAEQLAMLNAMYKEHGKVVEEIDGHYSLRNMTDDEKHAQWFETLNADERIAYSEYMRESETEALQDELQLAQDRVSDLERQLYACEQNLEEQIRLTDQARRLAIKYLDEL